jgi:Asp-tRNA(Asn)/Glu-tRNA(Gln) amidotransferase C subunit
MDTMNNTLAKIAELTVINTNEINNLKKKDEKIITSVGNLNELTNIVFDFMKGVTDGYNTIKKDIETVKLDFEDAIQKINKEKELAIATVRISKSLEGYFSQAEFGNHFKVKIGAKTVGKLFRVVKIAKSSKKNTEPYDNLCPVYAKPSSYIDGYGNERVTFKYNYQKCVNKIDNWLEEKGLLEQFYSNSTPSEMESYITNLHSTYIGV